MLLCLLIALRSGFPCNRDAKSKLGRWKIFCFCFKEAPSESPLCFTHLWRAFSLFALHTSSQGVVALTNMLPHQKLFSLHQIKQAFVAFNDLAMSGLLVTDSSVQVTFLHFYNVKHFVYLFLSSFSLAVI